MEKRSYGFLWQNKLRTMLAVLRNHKESTDVKFILGHPKNVWEIMNSSALAKIQWIFKKGVFVSVWTFLILTLIKLKWLRSFIILWFVFFFFHFAEKGNQGGPSSQRISSFHVSRYLWKFLLFESHTNSQESHSNSQKSFKSLMKFDYCQISKDIDCI